MVWFVHELVLDVAAWLPNPIKVILCDIIMVPSLTGEGAVHSYVFWTGRRQQLRRIRRGTRQRVVDGEAPQRVRRLLTTRIDLPSLPLSLAHTFKDRGPSGKSVP